MKKTRSENVALKVTVEEPAHEGRKDYVGKSGVYPMSGPLPAVDAPLRGQMEWGQGGRGAAGYEDHGGSELHFEAGTVFGGFDPNVIYASAETPQRRVSVPEWPAFSRWLTSSAHGLVATLELIDPKGNNAMQVRERPFAGLLARILENGVCALTFVFDFPPQRTLFNLNGPRGLTIHRNSSGYPTRLEIEHADGRAILHFSSPPTPRQRFTGNSWGE